MTETRDIQTGRILEAIANLKEGQMQSRRDIFNVFEDIRGEIKHHSDLLTTLSTQFASHSASDIAVQEALVQAMKAQGAAVESLKESKWKAVGAIAVLSTLFGFAGSLFAK